MNINNDNFLLFCKQLSTLSANNLVFLILISCLSFNSDCLLAYPMDATNDTGIQRLSGWLYGQHTPLKGVLKLPAGCLLDSRHIKLHLTEHKTLAIPEPDSSMAEQIKLFLGEHDNKYGIALLDISDLENPVYAEHNADMSLNPGSVGKLVVAIGLFQALADLYPDDITARKEILLKTQITADKFVLHDHHKVPFWNDETKTMLQRPIEIGDKASLWTFLDWMLSASSNAAAAIVQKQLLLINHLGKRYPLDDAQMDQYLRETSRHQLGKEFRKVMQTPLTRNGLDINQFRQGSFFTREGKNRVPGVKSYGNSREFIRFLFLLEKGLIVDEFSSAEIKRLLYMTKKRIRYAASPALYLSAVYYKSGSLYRCRPEPDFRCRKYRGNKDNFMNSVAIVETNAGVSKLVYLVALVSNVLYENSAVEHLNLATNIHQMIKERNNARLEQAPTYALTIAATPPDSRIKILNIKPRYQPGIKLLPGSYLIKVTKAGYKNSEQWVDVIASDLVVPVTLQHPHE